MLHITIHRDNSVPLSIIHTTRNGKLMSEIPCQNQSADMIILFGQPAENKWRRIFGPIIDKNKFIIHIQVLYCFCRLFIKLLNIQLFIEYRDDNRQHLFFF